MKLHQITHEQTATRLDAELRITRDDDQAPPELELPTNCCHCGARLPAEMGEWVLGAGPEGPGWVCSQECAEGKDFPP